VKQPNPSRAQSRRSTLRPSTAKIAAAPAASDPEVVRSPTRGLSLQLAVLPTSPAPSMVCTSFGTLSVQTKIRNPNVEANGQS